MPQGAAGQVYSYFRQRGASPAGAAGIVGNTEQESSSNPFREGGGLIQGQGGRTGAGPLRPQLDSIWRELQGPYSSTWNAIKNARDPAQAAVAFSNMFEKPGKPMLGNRERYAREALQSFGRGAPQQVPGGAITGQATAGTSAFGATASYTPGAERLGVAEGASGANPQIVSAIQALLSASEPKASTAVASAAPKMPEGLRPKMAAETLPPGVGSIPGLTPAPQKSLASQITPLLEQLNTGAEPPHVVGEGREPGTLTLNTTGGTGNSGRPNALTNAVPRGTKLRGFLAGNAPLTVKRKDQGQDIQTRPGEAILAPGSGVVQLVQSNPGGFGISYPIVKFTSGPLAGHEVYIGHTRSALPQGAHFSAGTVLSHTGNGTGPYVGNATGLPGWAEIGLWPPGSMEAGKQIAPLLGT